MGPAPLVIMVRLMSDLIEHRREDGELVGWIRVCGEEFVAVDALGRDVTPAVDWLAAEEALEERGLSFLAEPWVLDLPGGTAQRVAITEVSTKAIRVREDDFGAAAVVGAPVREHVLPFPAPPALRRPEK